MLTEWSYIYDLNGTPAKTQLDTNVLMGEQEYPGNVLAAKRLMTDFDPTTNAVKHKRKESGPLAVAFVETKGKHTWHPTCYCYGNRHSSKYEKCPNVTKAV